VPAGAFGHYSARSPSAIERVKKALLKPLSKGVLAPQFSALLNSTTVADPTTGVCFEASAYRDTAMATPQDKVEDGLAGEDGSCKL
jgi:hypothetical protein